MMPRPSAWRATLPSRHSTRPRQAGRVLGVSIQTIRNWVAAGHLPAEKRGVRTMIPRQALLEEIERSRARPASPQRSPAELAAMAAESQRLLAALPAEIVGPLG